MEYFGCELIFAAGTRGYKCSRPTPSRVAVELYEDALREDILTSLRPQREIVRASTAIVVSGRSFELKPFVDLSERPEYDSFD